MLFIGNKIKERKLSKQSIN